MEKIRAFDRKSRTISIGCCAPVPLNDIILLLTQKFSGMTIASELNNDEYLLNGLRNDFFDLVVLHQKPLDDEMFSVQCGREKLFLAVPFHHKFASRGGIHFEDLNGERVLLYSKIGFWYNLCFEEAPNAKFIIQNEREAFKELAEASALLSFTTDVLMANGYSQKNCIYKPVLDRKADVIYYCVCKTKKTARFKNLFDELRTRVATHGRTRYCL